MKTQSTVTLFGTYVAALMSTLAIAATSAHADDISMGYPGYNGSGCPRNSVGATLSPDAKTLSVLFNDYVVEAKGPKRMDRKNCQLSIPLHIPQGLSVSVIATDYRGFNSLPPNASSVFTAEYFFAGANSNGSNIGRPVSTTFKGGRNGLDSDFLVTDEVTAGAIVWSPCGGDFSLRISTSMRVNTNSRGEQAMATVDSADINAGMIYHLQWKRCR